MATAKIAISIDRKILGRVDRLVRERVYDNRSRAIQEAVIEKIDRLDHNRLATECAKLDPVKERQESEIGMEFEAGQWPEY